jgi:hypothetical protein
VATLAVPHRRAHSRPRTSSASSCSSRFLDGREPAPEHANGEVVALIGLGLGRATPVVLGLGVLRPPGGR